MRLLFPYSRFFLGSRLLPGVVSLGICRLFVQLTGHSHSGSLLSQTGFHEQLAIHRGSELSEVFLSHIHYMFRYTRFFPELGVEVGPDHSPRLFI